MLIYDGDCGFCTRSARWVQRRLPAGGRIVAWQAIDDLGALGLTQHDVTTSAYWVDGERRLHRGHRAIAASLRAIGGLWAVLGVALLVPPISWLAAGVYRLVADHRDRLPGGGPACKVG